MTDKLKANEATDDATDDFLEFCKHAPRTAIALSAEAYDEFVRRLEEPPRPNPRLQESMKTKPPWETKDDAAD